MRIWDITTSTMEYGTALAVPCVFVFVPGLDPGGGYPR